MNSQIAYARSLMVEVLEKQDLSIAARLDTIAEDEAAIGYWDSPQYPSLEEQAKDIPDR